MVYLPIVTAAAVVVFVAGTQLPTTTESQSIPDVDHYQYQCLNGSASTVSQSIPDVDHYQCPTGPAAVLQAGYIGKLQHNLATDECPAGYWKVPGGPVNICYKLYLDQCRSWQMAQSRCQAEGLGGTLAEPKNPVHLRNFIVPTFGNHYFWLGAQGIGNRGMRWVGGPGIQHPPILTCASRYWYPRQPGFDTSGKCLLLLADRSLMQDLPNQPYYTFSCQSSLFPLCQRPTLPV